MSTPIIPWPDDDPHNDPLGAASWPQPSARRAGPTKDWPTHRAKARQRRARYRAANRNQTRRDRGTN